MELFHVGKFGIFWIKDPTLFDGLGPCFGLVQITGSIPPLCIESYPGLYFSERKKSRAIV